MNGHEQGTVICLGKRNHRSNRENQADQTNHDRGPLEVAPQEILAYKGQGLRNTRTRAVQVTSDDSFFYGF
jgi:hypothetical protein